MATLVWADQQSYDQGNYTSPLLDPDWINNLPVMPMEFPVTRCENPECGKTFTPEWPKQQYCSNACGTAVERRRLDIAKRENEAAVHRPPGPGGPGKFSLALNKERYS